MTGSAPRVLVATLGIHRPAPEPHTLVIRTTAVDDTRGRAHAR